ncbi:hypothetical protein [Rossellomorea aquimaris]|nr:hypothetical protein [Rossellomorea aquimaris]
MGIIIEKFDTEDQLIRFRIKKAKSGLIIVNPDQLHPKPNQLSPDDHFKS